MQRQFMLAAAMASMTLSAAADASSTLLSEQRYDDTLVADSTLTCVVTPGGTGYIPQDTASAVHTFTTLDWRTVFQHQQVSAFVVDSDDRSGRSARLCARIERLKNEAVAGGGNVNVSKKLELWHVQQAGGYADTCYQWLRERLTVSYPRGVTLVAEQTKELAHKPLRDCN